MICRFLVFSLFGKICLYNEPFAFIGILFDSDRVLRQEVTIYSFV